MSVPGFSIPELVNIDRKLKDIYEVFYSEFEDTPYQLSLFLGELDTVDETVRLQQEISRTTGKAFPGLTVVTEVLRQCERFVDDHDRAIARAKGVGSKEGLHGVVQTAFSAFEKELPRLQKRIHQAVTLMMNLNLAIILKKSFGATEVHPAPQLSPGGVLEDESPDDRMRALNSIIDNFKRIDNKHRRIHSERIEQSTRADQLEDLERDFQRWMSQLVSLVGLDDHPFAQGSLDQLSSNYIAEYERAIVSSRAPTLRNQHDIPPSRQIRQIDDLDGLRPDHAPSLSGTRSRTTRICRVHIQLKRFTMVAQGYELYPYRCCWNDGRGRVVLEHRMPMEPRKRYPYRHRTLHPDSRVVTFDSRAELCAPNSAMQTFQDVPVYTFDDPEASRLFQGDIRNRDLLDELEFDEIKTSGSRKGDAFRECIKVWRGRQLSAEVSITFPLLLQGKKLHQEIPLKWLMGQPLRSNNRVRLEFKKAPKPNRREGSVSSISDAGSSYTFGRISFGLSNKTGRKQSSVGSPTVSRYAPSMFSATTSILESDVPPPSWTKVFEHIDVTFADNGETPSPLQRLLALIDTSRSHSRSLSENSFQPPSPNQSRSSAMARSSESAHHYGTSESALSASTPETSPIAATTPPHLQISSPELSTIRVDSGQMSARNAVKRSSYRIGSRKTSVDHSTDSDPRVDSSILEEDGLEPQSLHTSQGATPSSLGIGRPPETATPSSLGIGHFFKNRRRSSATSD